MTTYLFPVTMLVLAALAGCGQAMTPQMSLPPVQIPAEQVSFEEKVERTGLVHTRFLYVPLAPEPLAALIIKTAEQRGVPTREPTKHGEGENERWMVWVGKEGEGHLVSTFWTPGGGSKLSIDPDSSLGLPAPLLEPLKTNIRAYLAGLPFPEPPVSAVVKAPDTILVTAGPLSQSYEVLGEVHVNTRGMINLGSALNDALFRSPLAVAAGGRTPVAHTEQMNKFLKEKAREQYGGKVDAIINTTYNTDHDGDVFASGLAVHFVEQKPPQMQQAASPERHLEDRLKELKDLREKGLISAEEYNQKRQELLQGL